MSLIRNAYSLALKGLKKGDYYTVTIIDNTGPSPIEKELSVYAKNEKQAIELAEIEAYKNHYDSIEARDNKYLGLVPNKNALKPSSMIPLRDEVFKNSADSAFGGVFKTGSSVIRLSVKDMIKNSTSVDSRTPQSIKIDELKKHKRNIIVSIFIWSGLSVLGLVFLMLGFDENVASRFKIVNSYIAGGAISIGIAVLGNVMAYFELKKVNTLITRKGG